MCVCLCACTRTHAYVCIGEGEGGMFDDKFVYDNIVCFGVGCFILIMKWTHLGLT